MSSFNRRGFLEGCVALATTTIGTTNSAYAKHGNERPAPPQNPTARDAMRILHADYADAEISDEERRLLSERAGFRVDEVSRKFVNEKSGEIVRLLTRWEYDQDGGRYTTTAFAWDWILQPGGCVPFAHQHNDQDEVLDCDPLGKMQACEAGPQIDLSMPGENIVEIKAGTWHQPKNIGSESIRAIVEFENPEDARILNTLYWAMVDNPMNTDENGRLKLISFAAILRATGKLDADTTVAHVPQVVQNIANMVAGVFGIDPEVLKNLA